MLYLTPYIIDHQEVCTTSLYVQNHTCVNKTSTSVSAVLCGHNEHNNYVIKNNDSTSEEMWVRTQSN